MDPKLLKKVAERYRELGALVEKPDGGSMILAPFAAAVGDDAAQDTVAPEVERDVAFVGKSLANFPARAAEKGNRLEELREMYRKTGVDEKLLRDDAADNGAPGFADRLMTLTASDESQDRYGDRILVDGTLQVGKGADATTKKFGKGWQTKVYMQRNPVFMAFHQYNPSMSGWPYAGIPLGQCLDVWADQVRGGRKRLRQTVLWDTGESQPIAPQMMAAFGARSMRSFSVGFLPEEYYRPQTPEERALLGLGEYGVIYGQAELLEVSAVAIPANSGCTDEKMLGGLREFADQVQDIAPELAYQIRSWAPAEEKPVSVTITPLRLKSDANVSDAVLEAAGLKQRKKKPSAANMGNPICPTCEGGNLTCKDCGTEHKGKKGTPPDEDDDAKALVAILARLTPQQTELVRETLGIRAMVPVTLPDAGLAASAERMSAAVQELEETFRAIAERLPPPAPVAPGPPSGDATVIHDSENDDLYREVLGINERTAALLTK